MRRATPLRNHLIGHLLDTLRLYTEYLRYCVAGLAHAMVHHILNPLMRRERRGMQQNENIPTRFSIKMYGLQLVSVALSYR